MKKTMGNLYGRATNIINMLQHMESQDTKLSSADIEKAYYKLGEVIHVIQGERREVER